MHWRLKLFLVTSLGGVKNEFEEATKTNRAVARRAFDGFMIQAA
jgi:hypothetical protein